MNNEIIDKALNALHNAKGLPALERNVASILQSITTGSSGKRQLVEHVVQDAALTQKVLALANSPMYAPFVQEAGSISSALEVLGADGLMHVALGAQMVSDGQLAEDASLSQANLASELARNACPDRLEDASVAVLMYDLGRLILTRCLPEESGRIDQHLAQGLDMETASEKVLGMTLQAFGAAIAKRWNLPAEIVSIIDGSGDPALINVAKLSTTVSSLIHDGKADAAMELVANADLPGVDKQHLVGWVQAKHEAITVRSASLPARGGAVNSAIKDLDELLHSLRGERKKNLDEFTRALIPPMIQALHATRGLVFLGGSSGEFGIRFGYGKGIDELRGKLRITSTSKPTAFHVAIENNVDVLIADVEKFDITALPHGYRQLLPLVKRFLVLPMAINNRVTGLLYCDWEAIGEVGQDEVALMRQLRDLVLPYLPH